jgi:opacity protein-like surface antigen
MSTNGALKLQLATTAGLLIAVLMQSPLVSAAETEYRLIPYLWTAGMDVDIGRPGMTINAEVDFDDYADFIDTGVAFIFDAKGEKWSFIANIMYVELTEGIDFPANTIDVEIKESIFEFGVGYRPEEFDEIRLLGGARYVELETTIDFASVIDYNRERDGWDPFIGLEWRPRRGNWEHYLQGDIGGGNTLDFAWQVALGTAYHFSEKYAFSAGYRYLDIDHDDNNFVFDGNLEGILIGLMFKL